MAEESSVAEESAGEKRKAVDTIESSKLKQQKYAEQRKTLGSSFGTRKAQKVQANRESNVIDTSNIGNIMGALVENINKGAMSVPTKAFVQAKQDELRPVPKYRLDAEYPEDAYPLNDIILPADLDAMQMQVSAIKKAPDDQNRAGLLVYRRSKYLTNKLTMTFDVPEGKRPDSKRVRIIYFASLLMGLYMNRRIMQDREKLSLRLNNPPPILLESVLARFSDQKTIDNRNADKLLSHLCVLGLYLDNFAMELKTIQDDLQLPPTHIVSIYKELGCAVGPLTENQRMGAGLTKAGAKSVKRAVLKVPLTFPPPKFRGGKR